MTFERLEHAQRLDLTEGMGGMIEGWGIVAHEPVYIAVMAYMLGQYRIQVWIQRGQGYP